MFQGIVPYVDPSDKAVRSQDQTVFYLRPLTLGAMLELNSITDQSPTSVGSRVTIAIKNGLVDWSNFIWSDHSATPPAELAFNPKMVQCIPLDVRRSLANKIVSISILDKEMIEELKQAARATALRENAVQQGKPDEWECDHCKLNTIMQARRRCPFIPKTQWATMKLSDEDVEKLPLWEQNRVKKGRLPKSMTSRNHIFDVCPIGKRTNRAASLCALVLDCIRRDVFLVAPPVIMEQPYLFEQAKSIVVAEMDKVAPATNKPVDESKDYSMGDSISKLNALARRKQRIR